MDFRFIEMDIPVGVKDQCYKPSISIHCGPSLSPERLCSHVTFHAV